MENNGHTCAAYVLRLWKCGHPHHPMEIQEKVMTPTYQNDFVLCKYVVLIDVII